MFTTPKFFNEIRKNGNKIRFIIDVIILEVS